MLLDQRTLCRASSIFAVIILLIPFFTVAVVVKRIPQPD